MRTEIPPHATIDNLRYLVGLGGSSQLYLTAYLKTDQQEVLNGGLRAHLSSLLDNIGDDIEATPWRDAFREQRRRLEEYTASVRPGTDSLLLLSTPESDDEPYALWLPGTHEDEVRFGPGAYILPLMNLLDEWEPLVLAFVEKDQAWLALAGAGRVEEVREYHANVPGRHDQGGWSQRRYERHTVVHVERHLSAVAKEMEDLVEKRKVRRIFLAGPVEPVSRFRADLPQRMLDRVADQVAIDAHASPDDAVQRVWPAARQAERHEEMEIVEELVTRAEKGAQAITGVNETLAAVNRHEVYKVVMAADTNMDGRYCIGSDMLFGPMGAHEDMCAGPVRNVWLRQELPCYALHKGMEIEIVHEDAARRLNQYGGLGGLIRSPRH